MIAGNHINLENLVALLLFMKLYGSNASSSDFIAPNRWFMGYFSWKFTKGKYRAPAIQAAIFFSYGKISSFRKNVDSLRWELSHAKISPDPLYRLNS